jgi:hypothetical protein
VILLYLAAQRHSVRHAGGSVNLNVRVVALALAFFVVFLIVGLPYWEIPYSKVALPNSLYGWYLVMVLLLPPALRVGVRASFMQSVSAVGVAVPATVLARVVIETLQDPTSHNLWPFEIIIAAGVGFSVALAGAVLGGLLVLALKEGSTDAGSA